MSNKSQLQTNNTNLDALISRINAAKNTAASLPSAGGSSGGGSIETCTVDILYEGISLIDESAAECVVYTNGQGEVIVATKDDWEIEGSAFMANASLSITVMKGSLLYATLSFVEVEGDVEEIHDLDPMTFHCAIINGDATLAG